jgi:hypothetical protein
MTVGICIRHVLENQQSASTPEKSDGGGGGSARRYVEEDDNEADDTVDGECVLVDICLDEDDSMDVPED